MSHSEERVEEDGHLMPSVRSTGAPSHWLSLVRERAPGFLLRLEQASYHFSPVSSDNRESADAVSTINQPGLEREANSLPDRKSESGPVLSPKNRSNDSGFQPLQNFSGVKVAAQPNSSDDYQGSVFKTVELTGTGQAGKRAPKRFGLEPLRLEPVSIRAASLAASDLKSEKERVPVTEYPPTMEDPVVMRVESGHVALEAESVSDTKSVARQQSIPIAAEASRLSEFSEVPTVVNVFKAAVECPESLGYAPSKITRPNVSDRVFDAEADRKPGSQAVTFSSRRHWQSRPEGDRRQLNASIDSLTAENFWPELPGLEKAPVSRERWPELPDDVWTELCRNPIEAQITSPDQAEVNVTENLWIG